MPACCVAGSCFYWRPLQPLVILMLSWGAGPFFTPSWGSSLHVIFVAVLNSKRPKSAREDAGTAEPRGQAATMFVFGFFCFKLRK